MSIELKLKRKTGYIEAVLTGTYNKEDFLQSTKETLDTASQYGAKKILIDARKLTGKTLSDLERYELGIEYTEKILPHHPSVRIAIVGDNWLIDPDRLGETVAVNRGAHIKVFCNDKVVAEKWLLSN